MTRMLLSLCLLTLLSSKFSLAAPIHSGTGFVGNGGEIVTSPDRFFLRDFYDYNIEDPYIGDHLDAEIVRRLGDIHSTVLSSVDPLLLAKKLTDLNKIHFNLGYQVLSVIQFFEWRFTQDELGSIDNDGHTGNLPEGYSYKTVANRFITTIRISQPLWRQLSDKERVGLVIHEAFYSLVRVACNTPDSCRQYAWSTREITARVFLKTAPNNPALQQALKYMVLPDVNTCQAVQPYAKAQVVKLDRNRTYQPVSKEFVTKYADDIELRSSFIKETCASFPEFGGSELKVQLNLRRDPYFIIRKDFYSDAFGNQTSLSLASRLPSTYEYIGYYNKAACETDLEARMAPWFEANSSYKAGVCCSTCEMGR